MAIVGPLFLVAMQAAPAPAASTSQQIFNAATAALEKGDCAEAVKGFRSLETGTRKQSPQVLATIRLRRGVCQLQLGEAAAGAAAIEEGLAVLEPLGANHLLDVRDGRLALGRLAAARLDYAGAEAHLTRALAASEGSARIEPLANLARITTFDGGGRALGYANEVLQILGTIPDADKETLASARTLRARILLNNGDFKTAYAELRDALKLQGGLSLKVNVADVITRSDLALAALLSGDRGKAREYLAYTGAGRLEKSPFSSATSIDLPVCDGEEGLRPDDVTVVQFTLEESGAVRAATPIYSTGGRAAAIEFARAVSTWSWRPEDAAAVPAFFRHATRVELRCSVTGKRPPMTKALATDFEVWLRSKSLQPFEETESDARTYPLAKSAAAALPAGDARRIPVLAVLGENSVAPYEERAAALQDALRLSAASGAPAAVRAYLALRLADVQMIDADDYRRELRRLLADPEIAGDPRASGTVRLLLARRSHGEAPPPDTPQLVAAVASDTRLASDDPIRVAALLQQASVAAKQGQLDLARKSFESTGLTEQQCALMGLSPVMKSSGASSSDFPMEALRWGFEGWVRTEFDVRADGRTTGQRAVIAYPPFVFNEAATSMAKDFRFESSYRPSGGTSCSGQQTQIQFRLPR